LAKTCEYEEDEFCALDKGNEDKQVFVDLIENPQKFTGYVGPSATKLWKAIYEEDCMVPNDRHTIGSTSWPSCDERQLFYRAVSGLQTSISVHVADQYFNQDTCQWERRYDMYYERVGKHPERLQNMLLVYALLLKAVSKAVVTLDRMILENEDMAQDETFLMVLRDVSFVDVDKINLVDKIIEKSKISSETMDEFKIHFRNISKLMDCVPCEKCRLWGKIQTLGIGTALKILFTSVSDINRGKFTLRRVEVIALINTLGRFSETLAAIGRFNSEPVEKRKLAQERQSKGDILQDGVVNLKDRVFEYFQNFILPAISNFYDKNAHGSMILGLSCTALVIFSGVLYGLKNKKASSKKLKKQ